MKRSRGRPTIEDKRVTITATVSPETKAFMESLRKTDKRKFSFGKQIDHQVKHYGQFRNRSKAKSSDS